MALKQQLLLGALVALIDVTLCSVKHSGLQLLTVATEANDGFNRFMKTADKFGLDVEVLGMGQKWEGGDVQRFPGGGQKILLLQEAMEKCKDQPELIVMFTDSYDVILAGGPEEIVKRFTKLGAKVLFSAEGFCWPDPGLEDQFPEVKSSEKRFLNSGGFIGYAPEIYKLVTHGEVKKDDDDQLYYTKIFLDAKLQESLSMKLDTRGEIFQNLNGALEEVQVKFKGKQSYLYNTLTGISPLVVHGNGPIKHYLNNLGNYIPDQWTPAVGCRVCGEGTISLHDVQPEDMPSVYMALFLEQPTPFAEDFLDRVAALNYPKNKIDLFIHYADIYHANDIQNFMDKYATEYKSLQLYTPKDQLEEHQARNKALEGCVNNACQYFFSVDGLVQIENQQTLQDLIERNRSVVTPMMVRPERMWSNFWGSLSTDGFYKRSDDYVDIIQGSKIGLWNVPYVTGVYLIHGYHIARLVGGYSDENIDPDMAICRKMRDLGIFMHVDNQLYYGHLVNGDDFDTSHLHNELYQIFDNKYTWEKKYINPEYYTHANPEFPSVQICPDVFWTPLVTPTFCQHLIEEMENYGQWSGGGHDAAQDERLAGGYEAVPTVDIHSNQIGWEQHWLQILKDYVAPVASKVFWGYTPESRASMNFVVRYKPGEQDRLKPHSDSSTFTVNVALNRPHIDFQGGGVRFLRYNCNVTETRLGWFLMHPGRLTHHHEGLPCTGGTRYIMVSFVDP